MATGGTSQGRPLGDTEMFYEVMQSKEKMSIYIHTAVLKCSVLLTEEAVSKSLKILSKFQPLLHMKIVKETDAQGQDTMRYTEIDGDDFIDLETMEVPDTSAWVDVACRSVNFDSEKGPLWKVVLGHVEHDKTTSETGLYSAIIVFFFHHGITDAVGTVDLICTQFIPIMNGVIENGDLSAYETPLQIAAPFEDYFIPEKNRGKSAPWYMKLIIRLLRWKNRGRSNIGKTVIRTTEDSYKNTTEKPLIPFVYSEEFTADILKASKANAVTVNSTLVTAISYAMVALCQQEGLEAPKVLTHNITVDLRKRINLESPQPMGIYVSGIMPKMKVSAESHFEPHQFWTAVTNYGTNVKKQLKSTKFFKASLGIFRYLIDVSKQEQRHITEIMEELGFQFHLSVSNLGNLDKDTPPAGSSVEILEQFCHLGGSPEVNISTTPVFFLLSTFRGKLMWNMFYSPQWVSRDFALKLVKSIEILLKKVCSSKEEGNKGDKEEKSQSGKVEGHLSEEAY